MKLFRDQDQLAKPAFRSREEYEAFRQAYRSRMLPILEKQRLARIRSERSAFCR